MIRSNRTSCSSTQTKAIQPSVTNIENKPSQATASKPVIAPLRPTELPYVGYLRMRECSYIQHSQAAALQCFPGILPANADCCLLIRVIYSASPQSVPIRRKPGHQRALPLCTSLHTLHELRSMRSQPSFRKRVFVFLHAVVILLCYRKFRQQARRSGNDGRIHAPLLRAYTRIGVSKRHSDEGFCGLWLAVVSSAPAPGNNTAAPGCRIDNGTIDTRDHAILSQFCVSARFAPNRAFHFTIP